jgi:DNA-binding LacI/PurR family transcriptional regulator
MAETARLAVKATLGGKQMAGRRMLQGTLVVRESTAPPR